MSSTIDKLFPIRKFTGKPTITGADTGFKWVGEGGQDFLGTKNRGVGENFFDLKESKRVKINDKTKNLDF